MLDSGSDRCIIKKEALCKLSNNAKISKTNLKIRGLTGQTKVNGETKIVFKIGGTEVKISVLVMEGLTFQGDGILGSDFLKLGKCVIDYPNLVLKVGHRSIPFLVVNETNTGLNEDENFLGEFLKRKRKRRKQNGDANDKTKTKTENRKRKRLNDKIAVHVLNDVTVPANSLKVIQGHFKVKRIGDYIVKKNVLPNGLVIGEGIVNARRRYGNCIPILIVNMFSTPLEIPENQMISYCEYVEIDEAFVVINDVETELKRNLREFYETENEACCTEEIKLASVGQITSAVPKITDMHHELVCSSITNNKNEHCDIQVTSVSEGIEECQCVTHERQGNTRHHPDRDDYHFKIPNTINDYSHKNSFTPNNSALLTTTKGHIHRPFTHDSPYCKSQEEKHPRSFVTGRVNDKHTSSEIENSKTLGQNFCVNVPDREGVISDQEITVGDVNGEIKSKLLQLVNDHRKIFCKKNEKISTTPLLKYKINLKDKDSVVNTPPYQIPFKYKTLLREEIARLQTDGTIRPSTSAFNSPVLCVKKPDGSLRLCIDLRKLNEVIEVNDFPLPRIADILNSLGTAQVFSTLDLKSAFLQLELEESSKKYTAFSCEGTKYEFEKLPFGLRNSPAIFQSLMVTVLNKLLGVVCFCYLDDVIIYSDSELSHLEDLKSVFKRLEQANLSLKLEKCRFFQDQIDYLGHNISKQGISCKNSFELQKCPTPHDIKSLQRYLGMANFFRKFIPNFASIAKPLYKLLKKDVTFHWSAECETAFNILKNSLTKCHTLAHPNYSKQFVLMTDASNFAIGACLGQFQGNKFRPLGFFSKTLSQTQSRYSATKREGFALVSALKHFQFVLLGHHTEVLTDHRPLCAMFGNKLPADTAMARWALSIQQFSLNLKYLPGPRNNVADYLSRLDGLTEDELKGSTVIASSTGQDSPDDYDDEIGTDGDCTTLTISCTKPYVPNLNDVSWSTAELKTAQHEDDFCYEVINNMKNNTRTKQIPHLDKFFILDGILFRKRVLDSNHLTIFTIVVPTSLIHKAINSCHYIRHADHKHTLFAFKFKYYHPHESRHIQRFVDTCDLCKLLKGKTPRPIKLKEAPLPSRPFEVCAMDILGPLRVTPTGNKYILTLVDLFSRYIIIKPLPTKESTEIINSLRESFAYFGFPDTLLSDNALEFTSDALNQFATINAIKKAEILPYSPFANGICESKNKGITQLLKLYVHTTEQGNWDTYLPTVANVLNNSLNETIGDTPSFACLNYDTAPYIRRQELGNIYNYDDAASLVSLREKRTLQIRDMITRNIYTNRAIQHSWANKKRKDRTDITIGSRVLFKNHNKTNKLDLNFLGPAVVTKIDKNKLTLQWQSHIIDRVHINNCIVLRNRVPMTNPT